MPAIVAPPVATPPLHSLLVTADQPTIENDRWTLGFQFQPENCIEAEVWDPQCTAGGEEGVDFKSDAPPNRDTVYYDPYIVETAFTCRTLGFGSIDYAGRAQRQLQAATPKAIEREFWAGTLKPWNFNLVHNTLNAPAGQYGGILNAGGAGYISHGPVLAATTPATGGTLVPGTYGYVVTVLNANGESLPGPELIVVVPAGTNTNRVLLTWAAVPGATGYNVYGRSASTIDWRNFAVLNELFIAAPGNVLTFNDTGSVAPAGALPTANSTAAAWTAMGAQDGLAALVGALGACGPGSRGMIHAPSLVAEVWGEANSIDRVNNKLETKTGGNYVVAGGGYPGTGPAGVIGSQAAPAAGLSWVYATDIIQVRLSDITIVPDNFGEALDRRTNFVTYRAERYAATSSAGCCTFAVLVKTGAGTGEQIP